MGTNSEKIQYDKSSPLQKKLAETDICELSFKEWLIKKQFQMTTTMRRKESKPTFDMLYIIPWLQARAIYTSKQILIKNRVLNFLDAVFICYPNTSIISFTVTEKGGGCVKETFLGCITLFLFFFMVLRLINHSSMIDQNKQSTFLSFNKLKLNGQRLFVHQEKDQTLIEC